MKAGAQQVVAVHEEHHVETVTYTKVDEGDFQKAPEGEVTAIYNPNPMGQMTPAPMMDQYGQPVMQPMQQPMMDQFGQPMQPMQPMLDQYGQPMQMQQPMAPTD